MSTNDKQDIDAMLRVNHAGEYGAQAIYEGQLAVFAKSKRTTKMAQMTKKMAQQEAKHLAWFADELCARAGRPSALAPVWRALGLGLGVGTALLGERAAHACTEAVEDVIVEHYQDQLTTLAHSKEIRLKRMIARAKADEMAHKHLARKGGAQQAPAYPLLRRLIVTGCRAAIATAKRI